MKILLASDGNFVMKYGYKAFGIPKDNIRIGYVTTASKVLSDRNFLENYKNQMVTNGYFFEEFDIENKSEDEIKAFFADKNIIHVEGGNTFYLLKVIRETKFEKVLKEFLSQDGAYIGTSAGAYVMCPTIEVSTWSKTNTERFGITDFTALNYVPFLLKAHYLDSSKEFIESKVNSLNYTLRILRDGQGVFINGDNVEFLGDGFEVVVNAN